MELAAIVLAALACSAAMSILAFMIGRCGRKLPIDGMLPHVVYSARFSPEMDSPHPRARTRKTQLAQCRLNILSTIARLADAPPQNSKLCATIGRHEN
jgi:hypothetical protein